MREFFREGDLVVAEVHAIDSARNVQLHTRSVKFGKLEGGVLVQVGRVKRQKHHFLDMGAGIELILGVNGFLYLSNKKRKEDSATGDYTQG
jgi:exosome complex component RRP4